jgi:hypothetical protein
LSREGLSIREVTRGFSLETELVEVLPILCHYARRIGLETFFEKAVSTGEGRIRLSPAKALRVATTNIWSTTSRCTRSASGRHGATRSCSGSRKKTSPT